MEAGEMESWRSTWTAILEFSSGSLPPLPPFRGGATDDSEAGGEEDGVPGDPKISYKISLNEKSVNYVVKIIDWIYYKDIPSQKCHIANLSKDFLSVLFKSPWWSIDQIMYIVHNI